MEKVRNQINEILINKRVRENVSFIVTCIPELLYSIGFDQNHPHHHLDVFKHTLLALDYLESNDPESNMALLLHDIGKPFSYQDDEVRHFYGHALKSEQISRIILERLGYDEEFISNVCYLIKNHDSLIDTNDINDLTYKLLDIQYADAKAHHPDKVKKRINRLNIIKKRLEQSNL